MSQFPLQTEKAHTAEFVLSESNGHQSRDNGFLAHPITVRVGQPLKRTAAATTDKPATYTVAAVGADCEALALYGGTSIDTANGLRIAVLSNNAEVNLRLIDWGAMSTAEQAVGVTTLATKGIKCRI